MSGLTTDQWMESWLEENEGNNKVYFMHNEGKSVFAEQFIRTLKN